MSDLVASLKFTFVGVCVCGPIRAGKRPYPIGVDNSSEFIPQGELHDARLGQQAGVGAKVAWLLRQ